MKYFILSLLFGLSAAECPAWELPTCDWETEMPCWGGIDSEGCPMPDTCIPMSVQGVYEGTECPNICPVTCGENEMVCPGGTDFIIGCANSDFCHPMTSPGVDGTECSNSCPAACDWNTEILCSGGVDDKGCMMPEYCLPMFQPGRMNECWSYCSPTCGEGEMTCSGGTDAFGCIMPDYCATSCDESLAG